MSRTGDVNGRRPNLGTRIRQRLARTMLPLGVFIRLPHPDGGVQIDRRSLTPDLGTLPRYRVEKKEAQTK